MLEVKNIIKTYKAKKTTPVKALDNVSISFNDAGMVFLLGKSGSGKSTLLNVMGGLDTFDSGEIIINGKSSKDFKTRDFDSYRNTYLGFIFQEYNILSEFTVFKNVALAMELQGKKADKESVEALLDQVDLKGYSKRKPNQLSGGQKQRIAIARALIKNPDIIMADEPTGALDSATGKQVFDTLKKLSKTKLVIVVSHDRDFAEYYADRIIEMKDGKIISDTTKRKKPSKIISEGFNVVNKDVVQIKKGHKFNAVEAKYLNELVSHSGKDVFICADEGINKDIKKMVKMDELGNSEYFDSTTNNDISVRSTKGDFALIKSKLKIKDQLKMGASGLKTKKIRLVITILLAAIAFAMFGISDAMSSFNLIDSHYQSIKAMNIQNVVVEKYENVSKTSYGTYVGTRVVLNQSDITALKQKYPNYSFALKYAVSAYNTINSDQSFYNDGFSFSVINESNCVAMKKNELNKFNCSMLYGVYPQSDDEVLVPKICYDIYKQYKFYNQKTHSEITVNSYADLINQEIYFNGNDYKIVGIIDTHFENIEKYESLKQPGYSNDYYNLKNQLSEELHCSLYASFFFAEGAAPDIESYMAMTKINSNDRGFIEALSHYDKDGYQLFTPVTYSLKNIESTINMMSKIFFYISIVFAVFSAILLMHFISISISYKKKEIGILRALGARGSDVYGIFFSESLIISLINFVVSVIFSIVALIFINQSLASNIGMNVVLFSFGIKQFILMLLIAVVVAIIATFLPTHKASRMNPIDAIYGRK